MMSPLPWEPRSVPGDRIAEPENGPGHLHLLERHHPAGAVLAIVFYYILKLFFLKEA